MRLMPLHILPVVVLFRLAHWGDACHCACFMISIVPVFLIFIRTDYSGQIRQDRLLSGILLSHSATEATVTALRSRSSRAA